MEIEVTSAEERFDWERIRHLMKLGIVAALMVLAGDMLLGWGVHDPNVSGLEGYLSAYLTVGDRRIFWSSLLGFLGIPMEVLCYFSLIRLIRPYSEKRAHMYRSGILGELAFGGCGVHVPCLACVFFYRYMSSVSPETALDASLRFGMFFLLPGMVMFLIFWAVQQVAHIAAFLKEETPYPRWCWIFCPVFGMALTMLLKLLPETAIRNALTAGWLSNGSIWMFAGLLIMSKKAQEEGEKA
ncbi:MAG: hypothetical protein IJ083_18505 [Clostridia bacterium]|nr:hypothetical protein [Clostridia bacterium]